MASIWRRRNLLRKSSRFQGPDTISRERTCILFSSINSYLTCFRKAQYERNFNKWGWRRKLKAEEWKTIERQIEKRKTDGKAESDFQVQGIYMPREKIQRGIARHRFQTTLEIIEQSKALFSLKQIISRTAMFNPALKKEELACAPGSNLFLSFVSQSLFRLGCPRISLKTNIATSEAGTQIHERTPRLSRAADTN